MGLNLTGAERAKVQDVMWATTRVVPGATTIDPKGLNRIERRDHYTRMAIAWLEAARVAREDRRDRLDLIADTHLPRTEWGTLISGVESYSFAQHDQNWLRGNARHIGTATTQAYVCWKLARRSTHTLNRIAVTFRVDGIRY